MSNIHHLFGACACERNQYVLSVPQTSTSRAQVFFDNTSSSRRAHAAPLTAWLRIPLDWYQSATYAQFPDETHSSIKRTFWHTPGGGGGGGGNNPAVPPTRRQFCGYCGTTLTAWNEGLRRAGGDDDCLDVTLGSLGNESLAQLEALRILPDGESEDGSMSEGVVGAGGDDDEEQRSEGVEIPVRTWAATSASSSSPAVRAPHRMQGRGIPWFEEMIEHSRLGRIRRQVGAGMTADGRGNVQWEVVEIGGEDHSPVTSHKRQKIDV